MSSPTKRSRNEAQLDDTEEKHSNKKLCVQEEADKTLEPIKGVENDVVQVSYVWEPDEWYYEGEWEAYKADLADEKEQQKLEAENEKEAQRKRRLLLKKDHERQLSSMSRMNLFEDVSHDDCENGTDDEEDIRDYDYDNAHLYFASKPEPKFNF
ncbi:hypothetical protein CTI12_AA245910 [Artemisia annua]|uniref:Uncharacterized protein n=1 Tax=Artemisia annua TaxID=35608 RepID=A0A2U1NP05_ARTAN|nr:hypothetical protein CTI12_AA245910 [Artemisia annua]